jgi:hypothetical protein
MSVRLQEHLFVVVQFLIIHVSVPVMITFFYLCTVAQRMGGQKDIQETFYGVADTVDPNSNSNPEPDPDPDPELEEEEDDEAFDELEDPTRIKKKS